MSPLTAAGEAHMAEIAARRHDARQADTTQQLEAALRDLHPFDLIHTTWRRGPSGQAGRNGYLLSHDGEQITVLEVVEGGSSYATGVDATDETMDPCEMCGRIDRGHWSTRVLTVPLADVTEVRPSTAGVRETIARRFAQCLASRTTVDDRFVNLTEWILTVCRPRETTI